MVLPRSTAEHYRRQQRLSLSTVLATRRTWRGMGRDLDRSWTRIGRRLTLIVTAGQLGAARSSVDYLADVLAETGQVDDPDGQIRPEAFAGVAGDGRPLDSLLYGAVTKTKQKIAPHEVVEDDGTTITIPGLSVEDALEAGERWLDMAVQTALADAERSATGAGIAVRRDIDGYIRMLNPPSCDRCAILAGRWYQWSAGFERHPRCDCRHIPSSLALGHDLILDATEAVRAGQVTGLSAADERAILDGADPASVVNAKRSMSTAGGLKTTLTGRKTVRGARLRPEAIYELASDREEAIALLRRYGYLT